MLIRERMALCLGAAVLAYACTARAGESHPVWHLAAASATGTPPVLTQGLGVGAMGEVERRAQGRPWFVSGRLGWMQSSAANPSWMIDHHQFVAALGAGATTSVGAGRLWAQAGGGASGVYEILARHQRQRIDSAGVPGGTETSFALGPYAFAEAGLALHVRGGFGALVAAGPTLVRTHVDGTATWRTGAAARLGVTFDF